MVGLCVERSPEMVIGLLGILKAGGAYLPLDPEYPAERLAFMLSDAGATVAADPVGADRSAGRGRTPPPPPLALCGSMPTGPTSHASPPARQSSNCTRSTPPTSSTPQAQPEPPKASSSATVACRTSCCRCSEHLALAPADRLLAVTTLGFDIAALELFLPLICGAGIAIAAREIVQDPAALVRTLRTSGATIMQATPTLWQALMGHGSEARQDKQYLGVPELHGLANAGGRRGAPCCARSRATREQ